MEKLTNKQKEIIKLIYFENKSTKVIAKEFNVTVREIERLKERAIKNLEKI